MGTRIMGDRTVTKNYVVRCKSEKWICIEDAKSARGAVEIAERAVEGNWKGEVVTLVAEEQTKQRGWCLPVKEIER